MSCVSYSEAHRGERAWRGGRPGPWPGYSCVAPPRGVTSPVTAAVANQEAGPLARLLLRHVPPRGHVAGHGGGSESGGRALGPVTPASRPLRRGSRRPERDQEAGPLARLLLRHVPCVGTPRPVTSGWVTSPSHGDPWSRRSRRSRRSRAATGPDLITAGTARFCRGSQRTQRRPRRPRPPGSGNHQGGRAGQNKRRAHSRRIRSFFDGSTRGTTLQDLTLSNCRPFLG